jgi:hypothetical protein
VHLALDGTTRYRIEGFVLRGLRAARKLLGAEMSPFASVSLMNRYFSERARLEVRGLGDAAARAFASATDLGTGLERPVRLERMEGSDGVVVNIDDCPPRTLLRVYWQLARS